MLLRKPRRGMRLGLALLLLVIGFIMLLRWFEHKQVYQPFAAHGLKPEILGVPFEEAFLGDNPRLHSWFFPATVGSIRTNIAVLVCHGNGGNISHRLGLSEALLRSGVNVLLFDYRGYGLSTGKPDEEGTYRDAQAAYHWLRGKGFAETNIIALGESLGGGVATELAVRERVGGLVLQSTFTCIPDLSAELFGWQPIRRLCSIYYDTCRKLPQLNAAVMVMHSRGDNLIRFHHAEKNFACAKEPKLLWEIKGDHNDTLQADSDLYVQGIEKFLGLLEKR